MVHTLRHVRIYHAVGFYVIKTNCLSKFLSLLREQRHTSSERFVKPAVVHDVSSMKLSLPLALP